MLTFENQQIQGVNGIIEKLNVSVIYIDTSNYTYNINFIKQMYF